MLYQPFGGCRRFGATYGDFTAIAAELHMGGFLSNFLDLVVFVLRPSLEFDPETELGRGRHRAVAVLVAGGSVTRCCNLWHIVTKLGSSHFVCSLTANAVPIYIPG